MRATRSRHEVSMTSFVLMQKFRQKGFIEQWKDMRRMHTLQLYESCLMVC